MILVGRTIDRVEDRVKFLPVLRDKHLFLVRKTAVPISHGIARLDDHRKIKGQLHALVIFIRAGGCFRERETVFPAYLIKAFLDAQTHQKRLVDALKAVCAAQLVLVAHQKLDIVIPARNKQKRAARIPFGKFQQRVAEYLVVLQVRLHGFHRNDPAVRGRPQHSFSHRHAFDTVGLMKRSGHAVDVHIAAKQHRKKIRNSCRTQTEAPPQIFLSAYYTPRAPKKQPTFPRPVRFPRFRQKLFFLDNISGDFYNRKKAERGGRDARTNTKKRFGGRLRLLSKPFLPRGAYPAGQSGTKGRNSP